jgi:ketosteroid isomerase-like protein
MHYLLLALLLAPEKQSPPGQVAAVLDDWHKSAAEANEERYFGHLAKDAIFLGTDATERWTRDEFRKFAHPYFAKGKAWSFKATKRNVYLSKEGTTAWFDEELDTPNLGPARGTGVLVLEGQDWKIAHYNLSVPIPNEIFDGVKKQIEAALKAKKP